MYILTLEHSHTFRAWQINSGVSLNVHSEWQVYILQKTSQYNMYLYILQVVSSSCIVQWCAKAWINTVHVQGRGFVGDEEGEGEGRGGNAGCV